MWLALLLYAVVTRQVFNTVLLILRSDVVHPSGFSRELVMPVWSILYISSDMFRQLGLVSGFVAALLLVIYVAIGVVTCAVTQGASVWTLRRAPAFIGVGPMHFQHCCCWTAACIAIGSALQMPTLLPVLLV